MAGHRQRHGRPTRAQRRITRFTTELAELGTAEQQLATAFAWFRAAAKGNTQEMRAMAEELVTAANRLDRSAA